MSLVETEEHKAAGRGQMARTIGSVGAAIGGLFGRRSAKPKMSARSAWQGLTKAPAGRRGLTSPVNRPMSGAR